MNNNSDKMSQIKFGDEKKIDKPKYYLLFIIIATN